MRILSQDGTFDYPYEECVVIWEKNQIRCCLCIGLKDVGTVMAYYSTEAKARKAMEMLRNTYYDSELSKVEHDGTTFLTTHFQFPQDSKIEV